MIPPDYPTAEQPEDFAPTRLPIDLPDDHGAIDAIAPFPVFAAAGLFGCSGLIAGALAATFAWKALS